MRTFVTHVVAAVIGAIALALVLPVVPVAILFAVLAWCADRLSNLFAGKRPRLRWVDVVETDPDLGYKMKAGLDVRSTAYGTDPFHIVTCERGWPGRNTVAESNVLVVGDSMAIAHGIDAERAYYSSRSSALRIKAVACTGYDLTQEYLLIDQLAKDDLRGKLVVWLICSGNDFFDAPRSGMWWLPTPYLKEAADGTWSIGKDHIGGSFGPYFHGEQGKYRSGRATRSAITLFYRPNWVSDRAFAAARQLITRAATSVKGAGGRLAVVTLPYQQAVLPGALSTRLWKLQGTPHVAEIRLGYLDERVKEICDAAGIAHVPGSKVFGVLDYLMIGEDHLNGRGQRKLRRLLHQLAVKA